MSVVYRSHYMQPRSSIAAVLVLVAMTCAIGKAAEVQPVQHFARAWDDWTAAIAFTSTFRLEKTFGDSIAALREGAFDEELSRKEGSSATGVLHKMGRQIRLSLEYGQPAVPAQVPDLGASTNVSAWTRTPIDEVTNGDVELMYTVSHRGAGFGGVLGDTAHFTLRPVEATHSVAAGVHTSGILSPLSPLRKVISNPYELFDGAGNGDVESSEVSSLQNTEARVLVRLSKRSGSVVQERQLTVWIGPALPVIEKIEDSLTVQGGTKWTTIVEMSEFVDCKGGHVPRSLRYYEQVSNPSGKPMPAVLLAWTSSDLGQREPTEADFEIEVPASTRVFGLKKELPTGTVRRLSLDQITSADIRVANQIAGRPVLASSSVDGRNYWLIAANVAFIVVVGLFVFIARRRRQWS